MDTFDERLIGAGLFLAVLFVAPYLYARIRKKKSPQEMPATFFLLPLAFLLSILVFIYSQQRPYSPVGVISSVVVSVVGIGFFSVLLYAFRNLSVFVGQNRYTFLRFCIIVMLYSVYFVLVNTGFSFILNGFVSLRVIALTPELVRYALPTLSALVLGIHRLTRLFSYPMMNVLENVSEDVIIISLLMFWLRIALSGIEISISSDLSSELWTTSPLMGIAVGGTLVSFEWLLLRTRRDLRKLRPDAAMNKMLQSLFLGFLSKKEKTRQRTLEDFYERKSETKVPRRPNRAIRTLDTRFGLRYRGRFLRPSQVLKAALLLSGLMLLGGMVTLTVVKRQTVVLATGYSITVNLATEAQLPKGTKFIVSENMENPNVNEFYAIPIALVSSANLSFEAPMSNRFISLNSSQFQVSSTGDYLLLRFARICVETSVYTNFYAQIEYNQTNNSAFDYRGFFREAEILYCLHKFGYTSISMLSITNLGEITATKKIVYACNETDCEAVISISWSADIFVTEDNTCIASENKDLVEDVVFLIQQTKCGTHCIEQITNSTVPFRILGNH